MEATRLMSSECWLVVLMYGEGKRQELGGQHTVIVDVELDALTCDWRNGAQCQEASCEEFGEHGEVCCCLSVVTCILLYVLR